MACAADLTFFSVFLVSTTRPTPTRTNAISTSAIRGISDKHGYPPPGRGLPVWAGEAVFAYAPGHWGCILADKTELVDERPHRQDADDHLLRSELLACVALLRRQMNTPVWESGHPVLCRNPKFMGWV